MTRRELLEYTIDVPRNPDPESRQVRRQKAREQAKALYSQPQPLQYKPDVRAAIVASLASAIDRVRKGEP